MTAPPATTEQPQPEPARPLTLEARAEMLARDVAWESAVETKEATAKIAQLARDFAREALLCLVLDQVSNTPHKYREEIEYAIAAAERPK